MFKHLLFLSLFVSVASAMAASVIVGGPDGPTFIAPTIYKQVATPVDPASGYDKLYFKSDNKLYLLTSSGTELEVGFSNPMTTDGDMIYQASGVPAALAIGSSDQVLTSTGSAPSWAKILNANIDTAAAITYGKLSLTGSIINTDIGPAASIDYAKLNLTGLIVNADIGASAAIVDTKLATIASTGKVSNSATTATSSNTNSAIVTRDGSGNFSAGTITAALTGNSSTATALASNPTDCGSNTYATTIDANGNLTCASVTNASTTGTSSNTISTLVLRDGSGNFSAGTITASLTGNVSGNLTGAVTGNASTATALAANPTDCSTNQFATTIAANGNLTCAQPNFTDLAGFATGSQGGTNNNALAFTNGGMLYTDGSKVVNGGAGTSGQVPISNGTGAFTWGTPQGGLIGEREYVTNTNIEIDASGWTAYADAAGTVPVDCTGGSPSSTIARNTTSPITGSGDLLWTKSANNRQGEGFSTPLTIGTADTQIPGRMTIEFDYKIASGTFTPASLTTDSDMEVFIYDVTNAALIQPFNYKLFSTSGHFNTSFQLSKNSSSYRLCVHTVTTSASAYGFEPDNLSVHPQINSSSPGPGVIVASRAHVSTGASTTSSNPINYDTVDYDYTGSITTGAGTWNYKAPYTGLFVIHGAGYFGATSNDLSAYVNNVSTGYSVFTAIASTAGGNGSIQLALTAGQTVQLRPTNTVTPQGGSTVASVNFFEIFMVGGSSGSSIPNPVIAASAYLSANVSAGTTVPVKFDTKLYDYSNSYSTSTGQFTAPVAGLYQIGGFINPPSSINVNVYKNGIYYITAGWNTGNFFSVGTIDIPLSANETIDIRPSTTVTFSGSTPSATAGTPTSTITFKLLQSFAPGSGSSNVASSSYLNLNLEYVSFGGSTEPSTCTSSPCTMYRHTPAITSVTRTTTGTYSINFATGTFSAPPVCTSIQGQFSLSNGPLRSSTNPTASAYVVVAIVNGLVGDANEDMICTGPR